MAPSIMAKTVEEPSSISKEKHGKNLSHSFENLKLITYSAGFEKRLTVCQLP